MEDLDVDGEPLSKELVALYNFKVSPATSEASPTATEEQRSSEVEGKSPSSPGAAGKGRLEARSSGSQIVDLTADDEALEDDEAEPHSSSNLLSPSSPPPPCLQNRPDADDYRLPLPSHAQPPLAYSRLAALPSSSLARGAARMRSPRSRLVRVVQELCDMDCENSEEGRSQDHEASRTDEGRGIGGEESKEEEKAGAANGLASGTSMECDDSSDADSGCGGDHWRTKQQATRVTRTMGNQLERWSTAGIDGFTSSC